MARAKSKAPDNTRARRFEHARVCRLTFVAGGTFFFFSPARLGEGIQAIYRNSLTEVCRFLTQKHGKNYMIWNLSEHTYDYKSFDNRVSREVVLVTARCETIRTMIGMTVLNAFDRSWTAHFPTTTRRRSTCSSTFCKRSTRG